MLKNVHHTLLEFIFIFIMIIKIRSCKYGMFNCFDLKVGLDKQLIRREERTVYFCNFLKKQ